MADLPSAQELGALYDEAAAKQVERGVKGEKAGVVREVVRRIVEIKKGQGVHELSQASLRTTVIDALSTKDAEGKSKRDFKLDQSHFTGIIASTWETKRDKDTEAIIVLIDTEKDPKVKKPKAKKKAEAAGEAAGPGQ